MPYRSASLVALASLALALGTQGAVKADGYASASALQSVSGQLTSVNVSAYQSGNSVSGYVRVTSNWSYFGSTAATMTWSTYNSKPHLVLTSAPFTFYRWQNGVVSQVPATAVITMTGSGPGAQLGFQIWSNGAILVQSSEAAPLQGSITLYKW